jgi:hypothetical protein
MLSLLAVFAVSAVAASAASAANEGPKWKRTSCKLASPANTGHWKKRSAAGKCEEEDKTGKSEFEKFTGVLGAGETEPITFTSGTTKLEVPKAGVTITCQTDKGTGTISGGTPGTDKATIVFEECSTSATCTAESGTKAGIIEVPVNTELAYETKVAAEKHEEPVGIIFRTTSNTNSVFVTITFAGTGCPPETKVTATGGITGKIAGKGGVFCKIVPKATEEKVTHEIECPATPVKKVWNWIAGTLTEQTVGLQAFAFEAKQVGKAAINLASGEPWGVEL